MKHNKNILVIIIYILKKKLTKHMCVNYSWKYKIFSINFIVNQTHFFLLNNQE